MNDDQEALHNRLKQNQTYNDHIVSQQAKIIAKFDKIEFLEERLRSLEVQVDLAEEDHFNLKESHKKNIENDQEENVKISNEILHLVDLFQQLKLVIDDFKNTLELTVVDLYKEISETKTSLDNFKKEISLGFNQMYSDARKSLEQNKKDLSDHFKAVLEMVPETPPYIQDLRDKVEHNIHVFEIKVDNAVDKAAHAEMLYKVLEKRTRQ